ncbi:MAG: nucleotidyltransferase domain-containing protein, partial [Candidatus Nanohaloarchaea archaeon]|nr:nucleotidyltransferase domain-containing protein [Candidatus Nanohaloarchaea archaeon]
YGSVARNTESRDSDVDVLVVAKNRSVKDKVFDISFKTMLEEDIYIAPKVITENEFKDMQENNNSFLSEIMPEAEIYA